MAVNNKNMKLKIDILTNLLDIIILANVYLISINYSFQYDLSFFW